MSVAYRIDTLIRVKISQPSGRGKKSASAKFLKWCLDNDVIPARGGGGGPRGGTYYFYMEDAERVRVYLDERGYAEVEDDD